MKKIITFCLSLLLTTTAFSQDMHFSQYFVAPQLINPAGFGVLNSFEAGLQYKGQWNSFTNGYTSYAAFVNKTFLPKKDRGVYSSKGYVSAGLNVIYDKAGSNQLTNFKVELPINVTKRLSNTSFLTTGIYVGMGQVGAGNTNLTWGNQFDGYQYNSALLSNEGTLQNKMYLDCGAGLNYVILREGKDAHDASAPQNVMGFSVSHLNRPDCSLYSMGGEGLPMRINFYEYYHIHFKNSPVSLVPSVLVQYQNKAYEVVVGASVRRMLNENAEGQRSKYVSLGLFYRVQDVCAVNCMIEMNGYNLGVNYDFNVSKLTASSKSFGGLELSLKMSNPFHHTTKKSSNILEKF